VIDPRLRRQKPGWLERDFRGGTQALGEAAPRPVLRPSDETGGERVSLDIPARLDEIAKPVERHRSVTPLIHGALSDRVAQAMPPDGMGSRDPMHEADERIRSRGFNDQMPVIREDAESDETDRKAPQAFLQDAEKGPIIWRAPEDRDFSHAAIEHMKERSFETGSTTPRHNGTSSD
jgi:hypothetical protein